MDVTVAEIQGDPLDGFPGLQAPGGEPDFAEVDGIQRRLPKVFFEEPVEAGGAEIEAVAEIGDGPGGGRVPFDPVEGEPKMLGECLGSAFGAGQAVSGPGMNPPDYG